MPASATSTFILVVDDDALFRQALQDLLEMMGYRVWAAANAHEGLRLLKNSECLPGLIISDFRLPGMDGDQFFERVQARESWQRIPFIFVSGSQQDLTRSALCWEPMVTACLTKPFVMQDLFDAVARATSGAYVG